MFLIVEVGNEVGAVLHVSNDDGISPVSMHAEPPAWRTVFPVGKVVGDVGVGHGGSAAVIVEGFPQFVQVTEVLLARP